MMIIYLFLDCTHLKPFTDSNMGNIIYQMNETRDGPILKFFPIPREKNIDIMIIYTLLTVFSKVKYKKSVLF